MILHVKHALKTILENKKSRRFIRPETGIHRYQKLFWLVPGTHRYQTFFLAGTQNLSVPKIFFLAVNRYLSVPNF